MMRPDIYPRTLENITAVLLYYFPQTSHTEIDKNAVKIYDQRRLKLNELEYAAYLISKNKDLILKYYRVMDLNLWLIVMHSILFEDEFTWGTGDRGQKLRAIKEGLTY